MLFGCLDSVGYEIDLQQVDCYAPFPVATIENKINVFIINKTNSHAIY